MSQINQINQKQKRLLKWTKSDDWKSGWTDISVETKIVKQVIYLGFSAVTAGSVTAVS
jgi:hypothetical protein